MEEEKVLVPDSFYFCVRQVDETTEVKTKEQMVLEDALHYLGGFTLPLKDDTLKMVIDEEGKSSVELDSEFALRLKALLKRRDAMDAEVDAFKDYVFKFLTDNNITTPINSNGVNLLKTESYVRNGIDTAKMKEMLPEVCKFFNKSTNVKSSVSIKLDKEEEFNPWLQ